MHDISFSSVFAFLDDDDDDDDDDDRNDNDYDNSMMIPRTGTMMDNYYVYCGNYENEMEKIGIFMSDLEYHLPNIVLNISENYVNLMFQ